MCKNRAKGVYCASTLTVQGWKRIHGFNQHDGGSVGCGKTPQPVAYWYNMGHIATVGPRTREGLKEKRQKEGRQAVTKNGGRHDHVYGPCSSRLIRHVCARVLFARSWKLRAERAKPSPRATDHSQKFVRSPDTEGEVKSLLKCISAPVDRLRGRVRASAKADVRPKALLPHTSSVSGTAHRSVPGQSR